MAKAGPLPSKADIIEFVRAQPGKVGKREILRAFPVARRERGELARLIAELKAEGELGSGRRRTAARQDLPPVSVLEVSGLDEDGELLARPIAWRDGEPPRVYLMPETGRRAALTSGDRVLARLREAEPGVYEARVMRRLGGPPQRILGIYDPDVDGGRLQPTDKRQRTGFRLRHEDSAGARSGELVLAEPKPGRARRGEAEVRVLERLGDLTDTRNLSLIAIHEQGLPQVFSEAALAEAAAAGPAPREDRQDLTDLPLVTIDGADARDFDDAVHAEADSDAANPGGWRLVVAIADVAHYVRPGSALDAEAQERGNSVYFPDRVLPMLPEALSNGWCSLKPGEPRSCLAAHLRIDAKGRLIGQRFRRATMRSAARLTYEQVQAAQDGRPDVATRDLLEPVIAPLYGAYRALRAARDQRGALDIDSLERRVLFDRDGEVVGLEPRARYDSHRVIEEFMIAANVAAATTLTKLRLPAVYRVHEPPDQAGLLALAEVLETLGLKLPRSGAGHPKVLNRVIAAARGTADQELVNELVLRAQSQAHYSPRNQGHFGLGLARYTHFTSPIRRYSDLLVHRALITGCTLGEGGVDPAEGGDTEETAIHISETERRAAAAERAAVARFAARYLEQSIGRAFDGRINGVTRFGLFVTLAESGADGLVPISTLPEDYYRHDAREHCLRGRRYGRVFRLGAPVTVRILEANALTGGLVLELIENGGA